MSDSSRSDSSRSAGSPPGSNRASLFRGVDRAAFAVALASRLRGAGVVVSLASIESFTRALAAVPPRSRSELYWSARICLVHHPADFATFDRVFTAAFATAEFGLGPHARRRPPIGPPAPAPAPAPVGRQPDDVLVPLPDGSAPEQPGDGLPWTTLPPVTGTTDDDADVAVGVPRRLPSDLDGVADKPFEQFDAAELALLGDWLTAALAHWPTRRTRREVRLRAGRRIALRPTLAQARRTGWEPIELVRTSPVRAPRRLVMVCDVSQSMQAYATAYLHLMRAAAVAADAEVFAFATSLTRLTPTLAGTSAAVAVEAASAKVTDRFGGTRIASNLRELLASHHGGALRGAVVVVASDGWDSDPPAALGAAMARLRRRAYRVIWLNPRAAAPGFAPLVGGMAAALPYCDELLPANTFAALADVVAAMASKAAMTGKVSSTR